ncbi:hypothetical protein MAPG_04265 [Magnaporthiopsis poae ATCC 64411]|uniref:Kelch repeat protein n=1 Tax=Magnaporthiopsis poae (strain ATCC 64411 / 73-15) TaxID=644358 RepID=A0A0C4CSE5_MAGP6|nr:hypothetical protein, variant [Magnaporthiopsis poae ATCC 64411]KLU85236.1 hypothetical protein MAPG_04265 [Magnaporthiopsis poae ATCC 64411]
MLVEYSLHYVAAVLGDHLYLFGGGTSQKNIGTGSTKPYDVVHSNKPLAIPLNVDWNTETVNDKVQTMDSPANFPIVRPGLWPNAKENKMYSWGGGFRGGLPGGNESIKNPRLRVFTKGDPDSLYGAWAIDPKPPGDPPAHIKLTQHASWTSCNGLGFIFGGSYVEVDPQQYRGFGTLGLVIYNMTYNTWRNESETSKKFGKAPRAGNHEHGTAACLPTAGTRGEGVVVFLGGAQRSIENPADQLDVRMDTVSFYDIGSNDLYTQKTTSESSAPLARRRACSVAARSSNNRSYEIFVFGGLNEQPANMHILTIPGFGWFQAGYPGADSAEPRCNQACVVAGNRQMISVGGMPSMSDQWSSPDPWKNGMKVFDMVNLKWGNQYISSAPAYESPAMIRNWYDQGGVAEWDNDVNRRLFSSSTETPQNSSGPNIAAIAGGAAAGGIVLTALVAGLLFWYYRRKRGRAAERGTSLHEDPAKGSTKGTTGWDHDSSVTPASGDLPSEVQTMPSELHNGVDIVHELQPAEPKPSELSASPSNNRCYYR